MLVVVLDNTEMAQVRDELVAENIVLVEHRIGPFPERSKDFHFAVFERKLFSEKHERSKFNISFLFWLVCWHWRKDSP